MAMLKNRPHIGCHTFAVYGWWRSVVVSALASTLGSDNTWMGDRLRVGIPSPYVTRHLGQFSIPPLRGR